MGYCAIIRRFEVVMATVRRSPQGKLHGQKTLTHSLAGVVRLTCHRWRTHQLGYAQTKSVVAQGRRRLTLPPPPIRHRTVARLEPSAVPRLLQVTYRNRRQYGLMLKTLFQRGARGAEFVHIRLEARLWEDDPHKR
jgi:hypothetical protein